MIEGASIICFAHDWGGDPTSKTHIMRILSKKNRILWINSIGMRRPSASRRDLRRIWSKLRRSATGCVEVEPNLFVVNPLVLPLPGIPIADRFNAGILTTSLRWFCRRHGMDRPILWTFLPNVNRLLGRLNEGLVIYHCVDEYSAFSGVSRNTLIAMEHDLVRRADLVFTSSGQLCDERRPLNPRTYFVSHGVDVRHFSKALDPETVVPDDLCNLPGPVVGFFGLIADWVDLQLVRALALARPAWSIVLIGKTPTDVEPVKGLPNVFLLGQKPYSMLPAYCKGFDVGIIPFRINELTLRANPLKLREYLAAGLPVVSTDLPEVRRYHTLVRIASDAQGFVNEIQVAFHERGEPFASQRVNALRDEAWEARVEELSLYIHEAEKDRSVRSDR